MCTDTCFTNDISRINKFKWPTNLMTKIKGTAEIMCVEQMKFFC